MLGRESKARIKTPDIYSFSLKSQIEPYVMNKSACFVFLNWPGNKAEYGTAGESGLWVFFSGLVAELPRKSRSKRECWARMR